MQSPSPVEQAQPDGTARHARRACSNFKIKSAHHARHGKRSASAPAATSSRTQGLRARQVSLSGFANLARAGLHQTSRRRDLRTQQASRTRSVGRYPQNPHSMGAPAAGRSEARGGKRGSEAPPHDLEACWESLRPESRSLISGSLELLDFVRSSGNELRE